MCSTGSSTASLRWSALLNVSFQTAVDAARLASRATVTALGGAVTNRRFQEIGALDVLPINYSAMPDLVASGRLADRCRPAAAGRRR